MLLATFGIVLDAHANTLNEEVKSQVRSTATDALKDATYQVQELSENQACNDPNSWSCQQTQNIGAMVGFFLPVILGIPGIVGVIRIIECIWK